MKPVDGKGSSNDLFKSLAEEFSVIEKTFPAIDANLAEIVKSLINEKPSKEKLSEVQAKYLRPENCTDLLAPKINKQIWQQLRQDTRNSGGLCFSEGTVPTYVRPLRDSQDV